jgi:hypothetical protein
VLCLHCSVWGDIAQAFLDKVLVLAREMGLLSDKHFAVGVMLVKARLATRAPRRKGRRRRFLLASRVPGDEPLERDTEQRNPCFYSVPDARLYRKLLGNRSKRC